MSSADLVLKVDLEGDLRRFRIKAGADDAETWAVLVKAVRSGFELGEGCGVSMKYKDDEGDLCTLAKATLSDCLAQAGSGPLKLYAARCVEERTAATAPTPTAAKPVAAKEDAPQESTAKVCAQPPGLGDEEAREEATPQDGGGPMGCRGAGPWKLLACLGGLRAAGKMSAAMIASLMLQFLPILAQRAHRKQEKLNRIGAQNRELLLPTLHRILLHLDAIEEAKAMKPSLEAFVSGRETSKLGDCLAALLKVLASHERKAEVAELIKGASEELLDLLPRAFPSCFQSMCPPIAAHVGARCACCNADPLLGPRFHNVGDAIDICGECFIDYAFEASTKFECFLAADPCEQAWRDPAKAWTDHWKQGVQAWKSLAGAWAAAGANAWEDACQKGWPKGKGKGKGKWHAWKGKGKSKGWRGNGDEEPERAGGRDGQRSDATAAGFGQDWAGCQWPMPWAP